MGGSSDLAGVKGSVDFRKGSARTAATRAPSTFRAAGDYLAPESGRSAGGRQVIGSGQTFARADYTPMTSALAPAAVEGERADVFVSVPSSQQQLKLQPNQGREFPRVYVREAETVQVRVEFAESAPGTKVAVVPQDGGILADRQPSMAYTLDADRAIAFDFTASANRGTHRVKLVTQRGEAHLLDFWVGAENEFRTVSR